MHPGHAYAPRDVAELRADYNRMLASDREDVSIIRAMHYMIPEIGFANAAWEANIARDRAEWAAGHPPAEPFDAMNLDCFPEPVSDVSEHTRAAAARYQHLVAALMVVP
jgi:hypothetical protein